MITSSGLDGEYAFSLAHEIVQGRIARNSLHGIEISFGSIPVRIVLDLGISWKRGPGLQLGRLHHGLNTPLKNAARSVAISVAFLHRGTRREAGDLPAHAVSPPCSLLLVGIVLCPFVCRPGSFL